MRKLNVVKDTFLPKWGFTQKCVIEAYPVIKMLSHDRTVHQHSLSLRNYFAYGVLDLPEAAVEMHEDLLGMVMACEEHGKMALASWIKERVARLKAAYRFMEIYDEKEDESHEE